MLTQADLVASIDDYERKVLEALRIAKTLTLPKSTTLSFRTSNLTTAEIERLAATLPSGHKKEDKEAEYVYIFALAEANVISLEDMLSAFEAAREFQGTDEYDGKKNLCKPNSIYEATRAIYVGRSYKPRKNRVRHD